MLKIACCDDELPQLRVLEKLVKTYAGRHPELDITFDAYSSWEELLAQAKKEHYHIYLLDIIMDGKNGIGIGKEIRTIDSKAAIIYTTISPDYAVQSYSVEAFYYLLKPIEEYELFPVLDKACKTFVKREDYVHTIRTRDGLLTVKNQDIMYIEYHSHCLSYHMAQGQTIESIMFRESFDHAVKPVSNDDRFRKISSSFVVNLSQVEKVIKKGFRMKDGAELTVSRPFTNVKKEYMDYVLENHNLLIH